MYRLPACLALGTVILLHLWAAGELSWPSLALVVMHGLVWPLASAHWVGRSGAPVPAATAVVLVDARPWS